VEKEAGGRGGEEVKREAALRPGLPGAGRLSLLESMTFSAKGRPAAGATAAILSVEGQNGDRYTSSMTKKDLIDGVLHLSPGDRAEIAREIIAILDGPADEGVKEVWIQELERRVQEVEGGSVPLAQWQDVQARIAKRLASRS
jgi:putative addiction module component (TIGR02574 family)